MTPDCLIPSATDLSRLSFLYTCRQIHAEAHTLAHSVLFSVTNRWHADDLAAMHAQFAISMPADAPAYPLTRLEFAAQWRQMHEEPGGNTTHLDTFSDYGRFVWDVLAIFDQVEELVVSSDAVPTTFAERLGYVMVLEADARLAPVGSTHSEVGMWSIGDPKGSAEFKMVGKGFRAGRVVTVRAHEVVDERMLGRGRGDPLIKGNMLWNVPKMWAAELQTLLETLR